jgi:hypothetical protein
VSCTAVADEDGAFCTGPGYLAYEVRTTSAPGVPQHELHIIRFAAEHGIYDAGAATLNSFQVHGLSCTSDRAEISGWGKGFEHYLVAVPRPLVPVRSDSVPRGQTLQIMEHQSDPDAQFDPTKDPPEPRWLWHESLGSHRLDTSNGEDQYFLVISGSEKSGNGEIRHRRTATMVEKNANGVVLHKLRFYANADVETID